MNYFPYRSTKDLPDCGRFWDKIFIDSPYWLHWMAAQGELASQVAALEERTNCSIVESTSMVWDAFCAAAIGDEDSPVWHVFEDFVTAIAESDMPLFVYWVTLGVDINNGMTLSEAKSSFITWLEEDENNGLFEGGFRLLPSLEVVQED